MKRTRASALCLTGAVALTFSCQKSEDDPGNETMPDGSGGESDGGAGAPGSGGMGTAGAPAPDEAHIVRSSPRLDEQNVYPAPVSAEAGEATLIEVHFSHPMRTEAITLLSGDGATSHIETTWSNGNRDLEVLVLSPTLGARPLSDNTEYALDLARLETKEGGTLAPDRNLRLGKLHFTTGSYDALLNHSCSHTFFGPFGAVAAPVDIADVPPASLATHVQYDVQLAELDDGYGGFLRLRMTQAGDYRLYSDVEVTHSVTPSSETGAGGAGGEASNASELTPLPVEPTPRACLGILYSSTLGLDADERCSCGSVPIPKAATT